MTRYHIDIPPALFFQRTFKADALEAMRKEDNGKAIELLKLSLKHEKSGIEEERKTLKSLCDLYFRETSFKECLETGKKLKSTFWGEKSEDNNSFRVSSSSAPWPPSSSNSPSPSSSS